MKDMYYTRSSKGEIGLCKEGNYTPEEHVKHCQKQGYDIIKASYNIIDLIEVGDYVNGLQVIRICEDCVTEEKQLELYGSISEWTEADIKWVTTKEQFENISYRIGE